MDTPAQAPSSHAKFKQLLSNLLYIGVAIGLAALIQAFVIRPFIVSGNSMIPLIRDKEYLIVDKLSYKFREPTRGEVIVFRAPPEPDKFYVKRVIGLPGDTVKIVGSKITIINKAHPDGFTLDEPFIEHPSSDDQTFTVPADKYFVMGDNRSASFDSRSWGPLPKDNISGRALVRLLPFSRISVLPGHIQYDETN